MFILVNTHSLINTSLRSPFARKTGETGPDGMSGSDVESRLAPGAKMSLVLRLETFFGSDNYAADPSIRLTGRPDMRRLFLASLILAGANPVVAQSPADPGVLIRQIYQAYVAAEKKPFGKEPDQYNSRYYSARINAQIEKLKKSCEKRDDICMPDADFLVDGQDFKIRDLKVNVTERSATSSTVVATFRNFESPRSATFKMALEKGRWVIDELRMNSKDQPEGYTLEETLKAEPPSQ